MTDSPTKRFIDTAVIPVAGLGTRMWPYTAGSPKFMAPISAGAEARPNIDYTLDDCLSANIKNLIFITSNGGDDILRNYLGPMSNDITARYRSLGKTKELDREVARRERFAGLQIVYIDQPVGAYGTAVPLSLARQVLQGVKYFAVTGGDDFIWNPDGSSELVRQISGWQASGAGNSIMGKPVARQEGPLYGLLEQGSDGRLLRIIEKPPLEQVPAQPLANISRYILSDEIWPQLDRIMGQPRDTGQPEYYITDVISQAITAGQTFDVHPVQGQYFDAGSPQGLLLAGQAISTYL